MTKKLNTHRCPTCGRFLNNEVAELRKVLLETTGQLVEAKEELVRTKAEVEAAKTALRANGAALREAEKQVRHWHDAYMSKKQTCETLQEYDHWLVQRNLWERIVNKLEPTQ